MRLETERLILRPATLADADAITASLGDFDIARMLARPPFPYRRAHAVEWLEAAPARRASGESHSFVLATRGDARACIGVCSLDRRADGAWHLGFWLAKAHWGRGLMPEAAGELLRFGFEQLDLAHIHSGYFRDNDASRRVHAKLGFAVTGEDTMLCVPRGNIEIPHVNLALTRADWRARQQAKTEAGTVRPADGRTAGRAAAFTPPAGHTP